jgi:hypothetical protein
MRNGVGDDEPAMLRKKFDLVVVGIGESHASLLIMGLANMSHDCYQAGLGELMAFFHLLVF